MQLQLQSLSVARSLVGVREEPSGSNSGKDVLAFLKSVGIDTPAPWCAAFVYHCIERAAKESSAVNPFAKMKGKAWTPSWLAYANKHIETLTGRRAKSLAESGRPLFDVGLSSFIASASAHDALKSSDNAASNRVQSARPILTPGMFFLLYYPKLKRVGHIGFIASPLDTLLLMKHGGANLAICDTDYDAMYDKLVSNLSNTIVGIGARGERETASNNRDEGKPKCVSDIAKLSADCKRSVSDLLSRGLVATIEGNTDPKGSRTGGGVFVRTRKLAGLHRIVGY